MTSNLIHDQKHTPLVDRAVMNDDQDKKLIESIEKLIHFNSHATDKEIAANAVQFIQDQRHILPDRFLHIKNTDKKAFFVVGSEAAYCLGRIKQVDVIDPEEISFDNLKMTTCDNRILTTLSVGYSTGGQGNHPAFDTCLISQ